MERCPSCDFPVLDEWRECRQTPLCGIEIGRLCCHDANPAVILFDGGRNVALPSVTGDEHIRYGWRGVGNCLRQCPAQVDTIGFRSLLAVLVEDNQVITVIGSPDLPNRHAHSGADSGQNCIRDEVEV